MIKSIYKRTCLRCGETFEATHNSAQYCSKKECQKTKADKWNWFTTPKEDEDVPLYVLAEIMQFEGITYQMYTQNRTFYIERHRNRCGYDKPIAIFLKN